MIKSVLRWFEIASGLKVNLYKSNFGAFGTKKREVEKFSNLLNCRILKFPFTYLGIDIGANPRRKATWDDKVLRKVSKKHVVWKHKHLSLAGRVCLINFMLSSIPLFYLSFIKMPCGMEKKLRYLQIPFLSKGEEGRRKISWVSWKKVCCKKSRGGLAIKGIGTFNDALLAKWRWALFLDKGSL